jgi:hypothetical protein
MLPPHPPHSRRARAAVPPARSSREKLAVIRAIEEITEPKKRTGLRVLGRQRTRATKPVLKVLSRPEATGC